MFKNFNKAMFMTIMTLAMPTMIEQLMQTAVQYIDTAMVGSLGTSATAAVGSTGTINWLVMGTVSAISIGFLAHIAKAQGANDHESAKKASAQAVLVTLIVGILSTIIILSLSNFIPRWMNVDEAILPLACSYFFVLYTPMLPRCATIIFGTVLRSVGDTKTPMIVGIVMNVVNIILNFLLIYETRTISLLSFEFNMFGAGLGVIGAAIASAISFVVGGIYITYVLYKHPYISPKGYSLKPDMTILKPCMKVAIPNMFQRFATSLGYVAFASMINSIGEVATAAHTIANTVESLFYIPGYGMQSAASTLAGNAYGAKDKERLNALAKMFIPIEVTLMIVSGGLLFIFAPLLMQIFSSSQEVIALGATVLRMVAISEPFYGFSIIVEGMLLGTGQTKQPFVYNVAGMWFIRIIGTFICTQIFALGLISAWACMIAHNLFIFVMFMKDYMTNKWNPLK